MPYTLPRLFRKYRCHHFHPTAKEILSIFNSESNLTARMSSELTEKKKSTRHSVQLFTQCKEEQCYCHHTFHCLLIYNTFCIDITAKIILAIF